MSLQKNLTIRSGFFIYNCLCIKSLEHKHRPSSEQCIEEILVNSDDTIFLEDSHMLTVPACLIIVGISIEKSREDDSKLYLCHYIIWMKL